jgi:biotin transport system substrate-specific component
VTGWLVESIAAHRFSRFVTVRLTGALISGEAIIFAGGCAWLALGMRLGWNGAIYAGALPFIPGEIIKMALVLAVVQGFELTKHA